MEEEVVFYRFPCFTEKTALETCAKPTFKKASGKKSDLRITFIDFGFLLSVYLGQDYHGRNHRPGILYKRLKDKWVGKVELEPQKRDKEGVWIGRL